MEKILQIIAEETQGTSYRTAKFELDAENSLAQIEYDTSAEIVMKHRGETCPPKEYQSLEAQAKIFSEREQILNYFLDGSRRVFKVDDIAYMHGSRKIIYPIVAGQVVAGCCRRIDKKLHAENFSAQIVIALPDVADTRSLNGGGFFTALANKVNARSKVQVAKILPYNTGNKSAENFSMAMHTDLNSTQKNSPFMRREEKFF